MRMNQQRLSKIKDKYRINLASSLSFLEREYHNCDPWEFFDVCEIIDDELRSIARGSVLTKVLSDSMIRELYSSFIYLKVGKCLEGGGRNSLPRLVN